MPDTKITALTALTAADPANDVLPIVDVSDTTMAASGTTKKISINNVLGCSGTATLASATITGDLTVDTSTLKVDSANNRVGIGTASPALPLEIYKASGDSKMRITSGANSLTIGWDDPNGFYYTANTSLMAWQLSGSTAMTLNSTGLGVGASPTTKLDVLGSGDGELRLRAGSDAALIFSETAANKNWKLKPSGGDFQFQYSATAYNSGYSPLMYLTATGNLGIGVTPSVSKLHVGITSTATSGLAEANALKIENNNATVNNAAGLFLSQTGDAGCGIAGIATSRTGGSRTSALALYYYSQATSASPIEGARLDASGNLLVGTTTTSGNAGGLKLSNVSGNRGEITFSNNSGAADYVARFNYGSTPTLVGNITVSSGGTSFVTTSDYRLKESVVPLSGGLARVSALKPSTYKWKADGSNGEGFIAHELAEVVPLAVTGEKDAVNEDGSIKPQGVDLSKVVPVLVAAIQELAAEVNALKNA